MKKGRAHFDNHFPSVSIDGVPISESAMEIEIGPCASCGKDPDGERGGVLKDAYVEDGVLRGTSVCIDCLEKEGGHNSDMLDYVRGDVP